MLVVVFYGSESLSGSVPEWECFDHDGCRGVFGRHGATQDQHVGELGRSGRESAVAMEGFCRNAVGPPEWECEAMGSVVVVEVSGGRHGATHDLAQRGVSRSGRESVMVVDWFCPNAVGSVVWVQRANLCRVCV